MDIFHTPPTSPVSDVASVPHLLQPSPPQPSPAVTVLAPVPVLTSTAKKSQPSKTPATHTAPPDWKPPLPVTSNSSVIGPGVSPVQSNPGSPAASVGQVAIGRNGGPSTSSPRTPVSPGNSVAVSPTKSPSPQESTSPVASSSRLSWKERDSGLSQSLLPNNEAGGDSRGEEMERLLEECRTTLAITSSQDEPMTTAGMNDIIPVFCVFSFPLHTHHQ